MACSMDITRSITLFVACQQCKLADNQNFSILLHDISVHHPLFIVENAQSCNLSHQPVSILLCITFSYPKQYQKSLSDAAFFVSVYGNFGMADTLNDDFHVFPGYLSVDKDTHIILFVHPFDENNYILSWLFSLQQYL